MAFLLVFQHWNIRRNYCNSWWEHICFISDFGIRQWLIAEKNSGSRPTLNWPQNTLQASNRKGLSEAGDWTDERYQGPDVSRAGDWTRHGQRPGGELHDIQNRHYFEILTSGRSNSRKSNCCGYSWFRTKEGRLHQSTAKDQTRKRKQR